MTTIPPHPITTTGAGNTTSASGGGASSAMIPPHRIMRYKEKFQSLREQYDRVNALNQDRQRELEIAKSKLQKLQAENDLLLDAISLTIPQPPRPPPQPQLQPQVPPHIPFTPSHQHAPSIPLPLPVHPHLTPHTIVPTHPYSLERPPPTTTPWLDHPYLSHPTYPNGTTRPRPLESLQRLSHAK